MTEEQLDREVTAIVANIAQGVINIDCGHTTVEKGSRVYNAMANLLKLINDGDVEIKVKR